MSVVLCFVLKLVGIKRASLDMSIVFKRTWINVNKGKAHGRHLCFANEATSLTRHLLGQKQE